MEQMEQMEQMEERIEILCARLRKEYLQGEQQLSDAAKLDMQILLQLAQDTGISKAEIYQRICGENAA